MSLVPEEFVANVHELYGTQGADWLQGLPDLLTRCENRFALQFEAPFSNLSWNLILKAHTRDGTPVVLKIAVLKDELLPELQALRAYAHHGGVRVIDADENLGAVVLERVQPGILLSTIEDDTLATEVFCKVFQHLRRPPTPGPFVSIQDHFAAIERYCAGVVPNGANNPLPEAWVNRATQYLSQLLSSTNDNVLLHGDLHHENILQHENQGWVVIDPKGIIGDPHFEPIQFLLNYEDRGGDLDTVLRRRIGIMSKRLELDPRRIAMWGVTRGVLEACWTLESGKADIGRGIGISERFSRLLT